MTVYWLMFGVALLGVMAPRRLKPSQSQVMLLLTCAGIALLMGLRHEVGGDWATYERQFDWIAGMSFRQAVIEGKDPAYYGLAWIVARLDGSIYFLNLLCAAPLALGVASLARRQPMPWLSLLAAVPYLLIVVGMGYTRQSAAIGFALFGLVALGSGKTWRFVVWVLIGAAFHKSAVLLIPIAALAASRNRIWTMTWVGAMALVGGWILLYDSADTLVANYVESDYADASQGAAVRVFMNVVPAIIFLWKRYVLAPGVSERRLWTWMAILALACVPLLPVSATAVDRVALFFIPLQLFVFGRLSRLSNDIKNRTLIVIAVASYYASVQFVWLNFASHANAWVPYQFMPLW